MNPFKIRIPTRWILSLIIILFIWFIIHKYGWTPNQFLNEILDFIKWLITSIK